MRVVVHAAWIVAAVAGFQKSKRVEAHRQRSVIYISQIVTEKAPLVLPGLTCLCAREKVKSFDQPAYHNLISLRWKNLSL